MRAGGGTRRGRLPAVAAVLPLRIVSALWSLTSGATYPSSRWGRGGNKEVGTRFSERAPWLPGRSLSVSIGNFRKYPWRFHLRRRRSPPAMATAGKPAAATPSTSSHALDSVHFSSGNPRIEETRGVVLLHPDPPAASSSPHLPVSHAL